MRQHLVFGTLVVGFCCFSLVSGCDSTPEFGQGDGDGDGTAAGTGEGGMGGAKDDISVGATGQGASSSGGGIPVSPCGDLYCRQEERCVERKGEASCVPNTCDELDCSSSEECLENSLGAYCEDIRCEADIDCSATRYCDSDKNICVDDECTPGARSCSEDGTPGEGGTSVYRCSSSGSGFIKETDCNSASSFVSSCTEPGVGSAGCSCEDDWDCPGYQDCEAGVCQGSLVAPTCRLDPADIADVLPSQEIVWGTAPAGSVDGRLRVLDGKNVPLLGDETGGNGEPLPANLSPWSSYTQATQVPIVANLDDDNGDGQIDERDVAEILFIAFKNGKENNNGVLRVLHGGGTAASGESLKGRDFVSVCGSNRYHEGVFYDAGDSVLGSEPSCGSVEAEFDPGATLAVGDLNYDGVPEIVVFGEETENSDGFSNSKGRFTILDNTGRQLFRSDLITFAGSDSAENPGISLANAVTASDPKDEIAEIIIGRDVFTLAIDAGSWSLQNRFQGGSASGINDQGPISCVADILPGRPGMEIVAGSAVYGVPLLDGELDTSSQTLVTLASDSGRQGFCAVADVWGADAAQRPGPANPLDQTPEVILIQGGNLYIYSVSATPPANSGEEWFVTLTELTAGNGGVQSLPGGGGGGAPNIDDFDGDGFPEVGTAGSAGYVVFDLQASTGSSGSCQDWNSFGDPTVSSTRTPPTGDCQTSEECNPDADPSTWTFACNKNANVGQGACVCLHNSWRRLTQDGSSKVTGSSVFDFNGDGAAEVIYNDECHFRMYSGLDGTEVFIEESESRTRIEYPIVADVDNDGNAEIVFATTTESAFCNRASYSQDCSVDADCPSGTLAKGQKCISGECQVVDPGVFNAGIEVWGDLSDRWVSARRVWNEYSYHVTNVNESGGIPRSEPDSWAPLGARLYNTYRSQPRSFGSAPDLVVSELQVIEPGSCGTSSDLVIGVKVTNQGDLRVSGVPVALVGSWESPKVTEPLLDQDGNALVHLITQSLEPGASVVFQLTYDAANNSQGTFPDSVNVTADPATSGDGIARECREDNNQKSANVTASPPLPDLRMLLDEPGDTCDRIVKGTVINDAAVSAPDVVVRIYAGDPATGAPAIGDIVVGSVGAGKQVNFNEKLANFPVRAPIRLFGVVDPDDEIAECNEANNQAGPTGPTRCFQVN